MTARDGHAVQLGANLSRSPDKQVGLRLPAALDDKLDRLCETAIEAGERTNRKEVVAALIAVCGLDGPALGEALRTYRTMKVRDALPSQPAGTAVVHLVDQKPGPRRLSR